MNNNKLISENLFEFKKGLDPVDSLGLGRKVMIEEWLINNIYRCNLNSFVIRDDYTIIFHPTTKVSFVEHIIIINNFNITKLPEFIQFSTICGNLWASSCSFTTFKGFPKKIYKDTVSRGYGNLDISRNNNEFESLDYFPEYIENNLTCSQRFINKFSEKEIRKKCKIGGTIIIDY